MAAQVGNIRVTLGGKERTVGLLSAEDLVELSLICPNPTGDPINLAALDRFAMHPTGCTHIVLAAARKVDSSLKYEDVAKWGSIFTRGKAAKYIFDLSVLSGEEDLVPKAMGGEESGTSGSTPASSPPSAPDSATPGK